MAATAVVVDRGAAGDLAFRIVDVTLDAAPPVGGYALAPRDFGLGLNGVIYFVSAGGASKTGGWEAAWDYTNNKLQIFDSSGAAGAGMVGVTGVNLSAVVVRLLVMGKGHG